MWAERISPAHRSIRIPAISPEEPLDLLRFGDTHAAGGI